MAAIYTNLQTGTITDNPLLIGGTTVNSAAFSTLPVITTPDFMWMTLDPTSVAGVPEIVKVTAHTSAATVCTIVRGQQTSQGGGAARQHLVSTKWAVAGTANDMDDLPHRLLTAKGGLVSASAAATPSVLAVGTDWQLLAAKAAETTGLKFVDGVTTKGDLQTFSTVPARLAVGADHTHPVADSSAATGLRYANGLTTKGDLSTFDTAEQRLAVGANQQYVRANSANGTGLEWAWNGMPVFASTAARDSAITSPAAGMVVYINSNDATEGIYSYHGAAWTKPWNMPWGLQAYNVDSTPRNSSINSGASLVVFTSPFTWSPLTGRLYEVTYHASRVFGSGNAGSSLVVSLCDQAGATIQNIAVRVGLGNSEAPIHATFYGTWTTGAISGFQIRATDTYSTASTFQNGTYASYLAVKDIGPAAGP